jgi:regulator of sigma E protease
MDAGRIILAILGIAFLMVVHETGHFVAARRFGMRVITYSIGFGPAIWKYKPKDSPTTYQIAIIPFLAYVRIAGINPFEEIDPNDKESYANASLTARIVTIFAGSFANYIFASILIFLGLAGWGRQEVVDTALQINPQAEGPAATAGLRRGDRVLSVNGIQLHDWKDLTREVSCRPGQEIDIEVEREGKSMHFKPKVMISTPQPGAEPKGMIKVTADHRDVKVSSKEAFLEAVKAPPEVVAGTVKAIWGIFRGTEKANVSGMVSMVETSSSFIKDGPGDALQWFGHLSAYLGGFNLLPFPGLDGGRLVFLIYEAIARRRANEKVEVAVHTIGILFFLGLMSFVTIRELLPKPPQVPVLPATCT